MAARRGQKNANTTRAPTPAPTQSRIERRAPKPEELNAEQRKFYDLLSDDMKENFLNMVLPPIVIDVTARDTKKAALQGTVEILDRIIEGATKRKEHLNGLITGLDDGLDPSTIDLRKEATMPEVDGVKIAVVKGPRGNKGTEQG